MASETLHEDSKKIGPAVINRHRAIVSLMEELEAIDWYDQRVAATEDEELRSILAHNRDDEKEHAAMLLEWLRRHDDALAAQMGLFLGKEGATDEQPAPPSSASTAEPSGSLGIGSLRDAGCER